MQDIPEDRESLEVRWHFSTMLEPVPRKSKGCAASPWLTQWLHPRGPQGLGSNFMEDKVDLKEHGEKLELRFIHLLGQTP
ncbi:uncharacterized protein [Macaca nemestrina]|uniref:uncharacterized protein isoform X4 n=1 Tax=Macaca nemestrina TaxID=9545 RepID=UPI0039B921BD